MGSKPWRIDFLHAILVRMILIAHCNFQAIIDLCAPADDLARLATKLSHLSFHLQPWSTFDRPKL